MDPNQPVPTPIQPETPNQPVVPPIEPTMQPVLPPNPPQQQPSASTFQPFQPVSPFGQPTVDTQPVSQSELTGSTTQQPFTQPIDYGTSYQPKKSKAKLFIIIGIVLVALIGVGLAAWFLLFDKMALKEYSNSDYSIMVPESYKETKVGTGVNFEKPGTKSGYESAVDVTVTPLIEAYNREDYVKELDNIFTKDELSSGGSYSLSGLSQTASDIAVEKTTKDGMDIRKASANILDKGELVGKVKVVIIISDKNAYTIAIKAHSTEPKLYASADTIINSFKEK